MRAPNLDLARANAARLLAPLVDPVDPGALELEDGDGVDEVDASPDELADPEESSLLPAAMLLVTIGTSLAAKRFGPHWACDERRAMQIARPLVRIVHKYCPSLESYGPETELGLALGDYVLAGVGPMLTGMTAEVHAESRPTAPILEYQPTSERPA